MQAYTHKLGIDLKIDNYKDLECYKVELSKKEYVHLLDKIDQLERTIDSLNFENSKQKAAYEDQINDLRRWSAKQLSDKQKELMEIISGLKCRIANDAEYKKLVMQQKNDSCVDRGVSKKSSGYFFLDAIEWREKVSRNDKKIVTWKYVIQTPFLSTYPRRMVEDTVLDILEEKVLPECGCEHFVEDDKIGDFSQLVTIHGKLMDEYAKKPYIYDWKMRANFVRGYWEIELFITREIEIPSKYQLHYCQKKRSDELKNNS